MNNIAVVYKNNKPAFIDIFKKENINYEEINIEDIADDASLFNNYDVIFVDMDEDIDKALKLINKTKFLKDNKVVIATSANPNNLNIQQAITAGASDFLRQNIDAETLLKRLEYYSVSANQKKDKAAYDVILDAQPYNVFTDSILKRSIRFDIKKEENLTSAWDYLIHYADSKGNLCGLRLFFSIAEWLVNNTDKYHIIYEEDDDNHYVTMQYKPIPKKVISSLAVKHCKYDRMRYDDEKISVVLKKEQNAQEQIRYKKKINAKEFMEMTPLEIGAKLDMLEDLEDRLTLEINNLYTNKDRESLQTIADLFKEYSNIIFLLNEFEKLSNAMNIMANTIENMEIGMLNEDETVNLVVSLLYSLIDDLNKWRIKVFVNQEAQDVHYLDDSLLASCNQISSILQRENSSENDDEYGDIELF